MFKYINDIKKDEIEIADKAYIQVLLSKDESSNFIIRKFTISPGGKIPLHSNSVEHGQFVLRGRGRIVLGGEVKNVSEGSIIFMPAGVPHSYENIGKGSFEFICIVPNKEDYIEFIDK